jgi:hypothetical protein
MTNEIRMTNDQLGIGHWELVIDWSFWFGHWSFHPRRSLRDRQALLLLN